MTETKRNREVLIIGLSMAITFGLLDIIIGINMQGERHLPVSSLLIPAAVTSSFCFIVYLALWYGICTHLVRRFNLNWASMAISAGVFIGTFVIISSFKYYTLAGIPKLGNIIGTLFHISISLFVSVLFYLILTKVIDFKNPRLSGLRASLIFPLIAGETLVFAYLQRYSPIPPFVLFSTYLLAAVITIAAVCYINIFKFRVLSALTAIMVLIVVCGPAALYIKQNKNRAFLSPDVNAKGNRISHVILITVDTLRADVLSSYGSQNVHTPNMDGLASNGVLFKNAYSSAPWTLPAFSSIMTGLPPGTHLTTTANSKLPKKFKTTAEYMLDSGYYTGAILRNIFLHPEYNIDQGFIDYYHYPTFSRNFRSFATALIKIAVNENIRTDVNTEDITDLSIDWLEKNGDRDFFLWIHYFDPHQPYAPPDIYMADKREPPPRIGRSFNEAKNIRSGHLVPTLEERKWIQELYDAEVRYVDDNLGRLIEHLKQAGLYENSLIIFTSDHGEEFWDHGGFEHGHSLYNEVIQVPLIIKLPGENRAGEEDTRVSTESIMRTILDTTGIEYDSESLIASSLLPLMAGNENEFTEQPVVSTGLLYYEDRESLIFEDKKYIRHLVTDKEELYDLAEDPLEKNKLSDEARVSDAQRILEKHEEKAKQLAREHGVENAKEVVLSKEKKEKLKALDYIQ